MSYCMVLGVLLIVGVLWILREIKLSGKEKINSLLLCKFKIYINKRGMYFFLKYIK